MQGSAKSQNLILVYLNKETTKPTKPTTTTPDAYPITQAPIANNSKTELEIAWDKACDMGIFDGSNPTGNVTRRQLAVVLDRLNLLK